MGHPFSVISLEWKRNRTPVVAVSENRILVPRWVSLRNAAGRVILLGFLHVVFRESNVGSGNVHRSGGFLVDFQTGSRRDSHK